jgi:hypothetical protein
MINLFFHLRAFDSAGLKLGRDYAITVHGDDTFAIVRGDIDPKKLREAIMAMSDKAGLKSKPLIHRELHKVDFLSALFTPVQKYIHKRSLGLYLLVPKVGRILARLGWRAKPFENGKYTQDLIDNHNRAVGLGLYTTASANPILEAIVAMLLRASKTVMKTVETDSLAIVSALPKYKMRASKMHAWNSQTLAFLTARYDISVSAIKAVIKELDQVKTLPHLIKSSLFQYICEVDL